MSDNFTMGAISIMVTSLRFGVSLTFPTTITTITITTISMMVWSIVWVMMIRCRGSLSTDLF